MSFARAFLTVSGLTLVSRVAGFVRDLLMAALLGAGPIADAFFVALKLPNFFRRFFAEGAMSVAFIPRYSGLLEQGQVGAADALASRTLALLLAVLLPATAAMVVAMPYIVPILAPGFIGDPARFGPAVEMARITFPYLLLISLVALFGGVLNARDRFAPFAGAPILFNACLIAALFGLSGRTQSPGHALSYGVAAAGLLQLIWLGWEVRRSGARLSLPWPRLTPQVRAMLGAMAPAALGAGIVQINLLIDVFLASLLPTGAVSALYYADRLNQLPLGVIGIAVGTALLPMLSRSLEAGDTARSTTLFSRALEVSLFLTVPAAAALAVAAQPMIGVLFERGAFTATATAKAAGALTAYAVGLPAYITVKVASTAYFARKDTATPVKIAAIGAVAHIVLILILIGPLQHVGLALGTALAAWLQAALLTRGVLRQDWLGIDTRLRRALPRIALTSGAMGAALYLGFTTTTAFWHGGHAAVQIPLLIGLCFAGLMLYLGLGWAAGIARPAELRALLRRGAAADSA